MERTCKKCGETKPIEEFRLARKNHKDKKYYRRHNCHQCENIISLEYSRNHKDEIKQQTSKVYFSNPKKGKEKVYRWRKNNMNIVYEINKRWADLHPDKFKDSHIKSARKKRLLLTDSYIVEQIIKRLALNSKTIKEHPELIELYRQQIKIKRLLKQKKNHENTETS